MARQGQQAEDRGDGGEQHRPQALRAGAHDQRDLVQLRVPAADVVVGVDEHDVVVHHDARQGHHAHPREDGAERAVGDQQAEEHPSGGHHHGQQNQQALVEAVELRHEQHEHQQQRGHHRHHDEGDGVRLFLVGAAELHVHSRVQPGFVQPGLELLHLRVGQHAGCHVGADELHHPAVDAFDALDVLRRAALHEVGDRHDAVAGGDLQFVECVEAACARWIAHADVHCVFG